MVPGASSEDAVKAVIENVQYGTYPDADAINTADLSPEVFKELRLSLEQARHRAQDEVRAISRGAGSSVDSWIAEAKKVQADIEKSQSIAREIIQAGEANKALRIKVDDASNKISLLETEITFNDTLLSTLQHTKSIATSLDQVQAACADGKLLDATSKLEEAVDAAKELSQFEYARFAALLHDRIARTGASLHDTALHQWRSSVTFDAQGGLLCIGRSSDIANLDLKALVDVFIRLNVLEDVVDQFVGSLKGVLLEPRMITRQRCSLVFTKDSVKLSRQNEASDSLALLNDVQSLVEFISRWLPQQLYVRVSEKLGPCVCSRIRDIWLTSSIPQDLQHIPAFQSLLDRVSEVAQYLEKMNWQGFQLLSEWVEEAPVHWLSRRKDLALAQFRAESFNTLKQRKVVERVERQLVPQRDTAPPATPDNAEPEQKSAQSPQAEDEWDAAWEQDGEADPQEMAVNGVDDEDSSAWENAEDANTSHATAGDEEGDDTAGADADDAWGWGDDARDGTTEDHAGSAMPAAPAVPRVTSATSNHNGENDSHREVTLTELYSVSGLPHSLLELIEHIITNAETLLDPAHGGSAVSASAVGLYSIPSLLIAMYRATAPSYYAPEIVGNMLMYNDSMRICDLLRDLLEKQSKKDETSSIPSAKQASKRLRLDGDIALLSSFGKRAYGREMHSQRTILGDLLDGAQGFTNCTTHPFSRECDNAVAATIDHVRRIDAQWRDVLSNSARLQSLGNLISSVMAKMIVQIEDMSDIGEAESARLKVHCDAIAELSDLFEQSGSGADGAGEPGNSVQLYVREWFKFQYLGQILESSLVDIKYLWQEGELSLEFEADEVVDLIEALFAASDHRRNAVADIRRAGRRDDLF